MIELYVNPQRMVEPATPEDFESIRRLKPGTALTARSWAERNLKQHRWWRALLQFAVDNHPTIKDTDVLNGIIKIKVGFAKTLIDQTGEVFYDLKSTGFGPCTQEDFDAFLKKAVEVMWSEYLVGVDRDEVNRYLARETSWQA